MLCCVQLSSSEQPGFLVHVKPVHADIGNNNTVSSGLTISRAGEGRSLQVYPGSVPEVAPVSMGKAGGSCIVLEG